MVNPKLVIIVPCFNEESRLPVEAFRIFLSNASEVSICFVNDASTDGTLSVIEQLKVEFPDKVDFLDNTKNLGKSGSISRGVAYCLEQKKAPHLAYLDADLATSLEECSSYLSYFEKGKKFVFASRILKIGSVVERKFSRFLFGRIIATFISGILDIKVYDTQCGCKLFTEEIVRIAFNQPFTSRWLFDVEIFSRILNHYGKEKALTFMEEVPVKSWIDQGESKVKVSYFFRLWIDLFSIWRTHKKPLTHG